MKYLEPSHLTARYVFYHLVTFKNKGEGDYQDFYDKYILSSEDRKHFNYIFSVRDKLLSIGCSKSMATCVSRVIMDKDIYSDDDLVERIDTLTGPDCGKSFHHWLSNYLRVFRRTKMKFIPTKSQKDIKAKLQDAATNTELIRAVLIDHGDNMSEYFKLEALKSIESVRKDLHDLEVYLK